MLGSNYKLSISSVLPLSWFGAKNDHGAFRLLDLPQDIVERVIGLSLPLDIMSLRKVRTSQLSNDFCY